MKSRKTCRGLAALCALLLLLAGCAPAEAWSGASPKRTAVGGTVSAGLRPQVEWMEDMACFAGLKGCAAVYDPEGNRWLLYGGAACDWRASPCSTFKIIAAAAGLEAGVLSGPETVMGYDGTVYSNSNWNDNLTLREAFSSSCVWYFRKVIDRVGKAPLAELLRALKYGNQDMSQWNGSGINARPELNGFWLESSLQVSPREQAAALATLFENGAALSHGTLSTLRELMLVHEEAGLCVYGKTGTGINGNSWFVGFWENGTGRCYFAVRLFDRAQHTSGTDAEAVALRLAEELSAILA